MPGGSAWENNVLVINAFNRGFNPGEIPRIDLDDIAEIFMMITYNMLLSYLMDQLREDVEEVIFLVVQPDIVGAFIIR